jgi:hypothetical protein
MREWGRLGNPVARTLRFLRDRDVCRIERVLQFPLRFDDFIGARSVDALPTRAIEIAKATATRSPMLAATYLRELVPPTSLEQLLGVVDRLLDEMSPVWRQPRAVLRHSDLARIEDALGRPLVPEDFTTAESVETLTPHVRAVVQQLAVHDPMCASSFLVEVITRPPKQFEFQRFLGRLRDEAKDRTDN